MHASIGSTMQPVEAGSGCVPGRDAQQQVARAHNHAARVSSPGTATRARGIYRASRATLLGASSAAGAALPTTLTLICILENKPH